MDIKRILFWIGFVVVLALIVWGLAVAMNRPVGNLPTLAVPVSAEDHVTGPANAPVTLVEYSDFQCPACGSYFPLVERLLAEASTTVRFVYRHFPLAQHEHAIPAALAAEAAGKQGKFFEMYRALFENQTEWEGAQDPQSLFEKYARGIGLDIARFAADLSDKALSLKIDADRSGGIKSSVGATPTFFVNGKFVANPPDYDQFKEYIEKNAAAASN